MSHIYQEYHDIFDIIENMIFSNPGYLNAKMPRSRGDHINISLSVRA